MKKQKIQQTIYLIIVIAWMVIVFTLSNQPGNESAGTSGKTTETIVNAISTVINIENKQNLIEALDPIIRKIAHFTIYLIGGLLIMNYLNTYKIEEKTKIMYCILIGITYAGTDELHQYFVEGRSCMLTDVVIDTIGVAVGVCLFLLAIKAVRKIKGMHPKSTIR